MRQAPKERGPLTTTRIRRDAYDKVFHDYAAKSSAPAAARIVAIVRAVLPVGSVLDVGCGYGTWLRAWSDAGVTDVVGIDGPWVDPSHLQIPRASFVVSNIEEPVDLGRRFDLVESLEVAEHLPASRAATFVDTLVAHSDAILFSAAPPGQGGENHVNEQPYEYWRAFFAARGFRVFDYIRPLLVAEPSISPWYRYNTFLYLRVTADRPIPEPIAASEIRSGNRMRDVAPWPYRWRRIAVRWLPAPAQHALARIAARRTAGMIRARTKTSPPHKS